MKKFRVWDKEGGFFYLPDKGYQPHYHLSLNGEFLNFQNGVGGKEVVVQQWTGLRDKNDKDIYEGDFVKLDEYHVAALLFSPPNYTKGMIKFQNFQYNVCQKYMGATPLSAFCLCECCSPALIVVGNIFQNPELLK